MKISHSQGPNDTATYVGFGVQNVMICREGEHVARLYFDGKELASCRFYVEIDKT